MNKRCTINQTHFSPFPTYSNKPRQPIIWYEWRESSTKLYPVDVSLCPVGWKLSGRYSALPLAYYNKLMYTNQAIMPLQGK